MAEVLGSFASAAQVAEYCLKICCLIEKVYSANATMKKYRGRIKELTLLLNPILTNPIFQTREIVDCTLALSEILESTKVPEISRKRDRLLYSVVFVIKERHFSEIFGCIEEKKSTLALYIAHVNNTILSDIHTGIHQIRQTTDHTTPSSHENVEMAHYPNGYNESAQSWLSDCSQGLQERNGFGQQQPSGLGLYPQAGDPDSACVLYQQSPQAPSHSQYPAQYPSQDRAHHQVHQQANHQAQQQQYQFQNPAQFHAQRGPGPSTTVPAIHRNNRHKSTGRQINGYRFTEQSATSPDYQFAQKTANIEIRNNVKRAEPGTRGESGADKPFYEQINGAFVGKGGVLLPYGGIIEENDMEDDGDQVNGISN
ncbi:hypothetical protein BJ166DRAFT_157462 [Pestalotiopsis sp. NC0098]|nr:hypothetical protein BJ166DRAFT_157462 [Pestalotiopsis sp. NC0098]